MRIVAGRASHALLIVLRVVRLRTFGTASRAEALEVAVERRLEVGLGIVLVVNEALVATFAVGGHPGTAGTVEVSAGTVAFFAGNALGDRVGTKLLGVAESGEEFFLALEVKLPGVADFAVGRTRLEHGLRAVRSAVGVEAPDVRGLRAEVFQLDREGRIPFVDLLGDFRRDVLRPVAGELVAAGNHLARALAEVTFFDVVGTADKPLVHETVLRTRRTHDDVNVIGFNTFRQHGSLGTIEGLLHVARNLRFGQFFREADDLVVTRTFPLFILRGVAFTALLRTNELVREVKEGFVREAIGHGNLAARILVILSAVTEFNPFLVTVRHRELADDAVFLEVLEVRVIGLEVVPEGLILSHIAVEIARQVNLRGFRGGNRSGDESGAQTGGQRQKLRLLGHI